MVQLEFNQEKYLENMKNLSKRVNKIGLIASILTAVLAAAFIIVGSFGTTSWDYIPDIVNYVWSYIKVIDYALFIPGFLMAPVFVVLMACVHYYASLDKKIFSLIGLGFALIYATIITADYFILWTVTLPSIIRAETADLSLLSMYNSHGIFVSLESLAYLVMSLALLFVAPVFEGGKIERTLRWIFIIGFILAIGSLVGVYLMNYDIVIFEIAIIGIYCPLLVISGVLIGIIFRRAGKSPDK
jgi:drug/metabolite transporter (DMT)-like permease